MKNSLLLLPALLATSIAHANTPVDQLPDTLVTASRIEQPRSAALAANTVFTRNDIERLQVRDVPALLQRVPGLHISRTGGSGSLTGVFLRGTSSAQTVVLVDGQRISGASSGLASLELLNIEHIDRIEVVRGGRSALYGSDAIGGVIQIFTRSPDSAEGVSPRARFGIGNHGQFTRSLGLSGGYEKTRVDLGLSLDEMSGFKRTTLDGSSDSAYRNKAASFRLEHSFTEKLSAGASVLHQEGSTEYDFTTSPAGFAEDDYTVSSVSTHLEARLANNWTSRLEIGHSEDRRTTDDPFGGSSFNSYRDQVNWINSIDLDSAHSLVAGADWYQDRLNSSNDFSKSSRTNRGLFVQHRYVHEKFSTELGVRQDRNQQFGTENTWSTAFNWRFDQANDIVLSYSESFRAPTFNDLYFPDSCSPGFGCTIFANPDLSPETARSYEFQWRSQLSPQSRLEVSLYQIRIKDAIVTNNALDGNQSGASDQFRPENIDRARINGFEATLYSHIAGWDTNLTYSHTDARNKSGGGNDGNRLARRPKNNLNLDVDRQVGNIDLGFSWSLTSHSYNDLNNENRLPGYGLLDLRASWSPRSDVRLSASIENLLDRDYYQASGSAFDAAFERVPFRYREGGRTALLAVTWTPQL